MNTPTHIPRLPLLGLMLLAALPAAAQNRTYVGSASAANGVAMDKGTTSAPASYSATYETSSAGVVMSDAHGGTISAHADTGHNPYTNWNAVGQGRMIFSFQVAGDANVFVPVRVQAWANVSGSGGGYTATAQFRVDPAISSGVVAEAHTSDNPWDTGRSNGFVVDQVVLMYSNTDNWVDMSAAATTGSYGLAGSAYAFVDPVFTIDSAYADRFSIVGLPSPVPEPATWAMAIGGLALVGGAARRARG